VDPWQLGVAVEAASAAGLAFVRDLAPLEALQRPGALGEALRAAGLLGSEPGALGEALRAAGLPGAGPGALGLGWREPWLAGAAAVGAPVAVIATTLGEDGGAGDEWARLAAAEGEDEPEELRVYDPEVAKAFFLQRPLALLTRGWRSGVLLGSFSLGLWLDARLGLRPDDDEARKTATDARRAKQLRRILIRLGPTYVKLGQVLSSRQDLLPDPYIEELRTLQDAVPPYDDAIARRTLAMELGAAAVSRLEYVRTDPVASASLGQVYRCRDRETGSEVAVKVQRPGALFAVSLDVAIIRLVGPPLYKISDRGGNLDALGLIDEWGSRFIDELDYGLEALNASEFLEAMRSRRDALGAVVSAPEVRPELSSRRVLTAEWVHGMRLEEAPEAERGRLCAVTLAAYLAMLLDTGTLHVDPHPGNLLLAEDGRVCILDWGLVTTVTETQQNAILSFMAHLVSGDYGSIDVDLAVMGFVAPDKVAALNDSGLTRSVGILFSALAKGGGAKGFREGLGFTQTDEELKTLGKRLKGIKDKEQRKQAFIEATGGQGSKVAQLGKDLEEVQDKYGYVFTIPSYFGYILRAFSVLEGIGLASDPEYSLANEAFPFLARRLLTDRSEATKRALRQLLYGASGRLSAERAGQLAEAFCTYTDVIPPREKSGGASDAEIPEAMREALRIALDPQGGPLQDVVLEEAASIVGATAASTASTVLSAAFAEGGLLERQHAAIEALGQQVPLLRRLPRPPTPYGAYKALRPGLEEFGSASIAQATDYSEAMTILVDALNPQDREVAANPGRLSLPSPATVEQAAGLATELAPGAQLAVLRFGALILKDAADRIGRASALPPPHSR